MLFQQIEAYIIGLGPPQLTAERKAVLHKIAQYITNEMAQNNAVHLNFICTHNSRRSQLAQIWAQTLSVYYGLPVHCYSGGVEVTAFNPNAIKALKAAGFLIEKNERDENPEYSISFSENHIPIKAYSKLYHCSDNSQQSFAAIMTCSEADENCPLIQGDALRIPLTYDDPKRFDGTGNETIGYQSTSNTIATEIKYIFNLIQPST
jgi:arsenate reductase